MTATERIYETPDAPLAYSDHYLLMDKSGAISATKVRVDAFKTWLLTGYASGYVGGNIASLANGASAAGQTTVTVVSTDGFIAGGYAAYQLAGGETEYNLIADIPNTTQLTLTNNIGTGGIANGTYVGMISPIEYLAANSVPHLAGTDLTLPEAITYSNNMHYNVLAYGTPTDGVTNAAPGIQATIDDCVANNGRYVDVPPGVYTVTETIYLKNNIRLCGAAGVFVAASKIIFSPTSPGDHLFSNVDPVTDYDWGIETSNFNIVVGTGTPGNAIHLLKPGRCTITNVRVSGFERAIYLGGAMGVYVDNCFAKNQTITSIEINESDWISTTVCISKTFVGESAPWGILVRGDAIHVILDHLICQSTTVGGIDIYKGSIVTMNDCYTEDVPGNGTAGSIVRVGVSTDGSPDPAVLHVHGGQLGGYNSGYHANSVGVYADEAAAVSLIGCTVTRVGKILKTTINTGHCELWGVAHYQTGVTPWDAIYNPGKTTGVFHNAFSDNSFTAYLLANKIWLASDGLPTGWRVRSEYANTNSDLRFYSWNGTAETFQMQLNNTGVLFAKGGLGVGNSLPATTLGSVTAQMEVFAEDGTSLGFVPIYGSIA